MVEAMTEAVSAMTMEWPKTSQGTEYKAASNYVGRQQHPSWHMVLMGCWSLTSPAITVRTPDI